MQGPVYRRQLGQRIRKMRDQRSWSQEEFAAVCELNRSYMGRIERGEINLTLESLEILAKALGISVSALLKGIV